MYIHLSLYSPEGERERVVSWFNLDQGSDEISGHQIRRALFTSYFIYIQISKRCLKLSHVKETVSVCFAVWSNRHTICNR